MGMAMSMKVGMQAICCSQGVYLFIYHFLYHLINLLLAVVVAMAFTYSILR